MPKISVILPVYNSEKYIKKSVESVLNQTFTDFELIILIDGSTDDTINILNSFFRFKNKDNQPNQPGSEEAETMPLMLQ